MKTVHLLTLRERTIPRPEPGKYFVIGVRNSQSSLEEVERSFGDKVSFTKFPEVVNPRYITSSMYHLHILQPAWMVVHSEKTSEKLVRNLRKGKYT